MEGLFLDLILGEDFESDLFLIAFTIFAHFLRNGLIRGVSVEKLNDKLVVRFKEGEERL